MQCNITHIASASTFPSSATTGTIHLKIGDEIITGTISGTNVTSLTQDGTTAAIPCSRCNS